MTSNIVLEKAATARFAVQIDRYFQDGKGDEGQFGLHFSYDLPEGEWNRAGIGHHTLGLMGLPAATALRRTLFPYYQVWDFADLDELTRNYITHTMAPLEWHTKLDDRDPEFMKHVLVYAEQQPTVPEPPVPPTLGEVMATGVVSLLIAGLFGGADKATIPAETMAGNMRSFTMDTMRELPLGPEFWALRVKLDSILRYLQQSREMEAVFLVRKMASSDNKAMAMWATQCMLVTGIQS